MKIIIKSIEIYIRVENEKFQLIGYTLRFTK